MARDIVKRNVVGLCSVPKGQRGRPSKSLNLVQARAVVDAAEACVPQLRGVLGTWIM
jgi:hypothetical protein